MLTGKYQLRKYALQLFPGEPMELFYVRWPLSPAKPAPPESELLGIHVGRSELGTIAQRMTAGAEEHGDKDMAATYLTSTPRRG